MIDFLHVNLKAIVNHIHRTVRQSWGLSLDRGSTSGKLGWFFIYTYSIYRLQMFYSTSSIPTYTLSRPQRCDPNPYQVKKKKNKKKKKKM